MRPVLTSKQKLVLSAITDLTHKYGSPPTFEELRIYLKYPSISSVQRHTDALKQKGYLDQTRGLSLPTTVEKVQIPLVGNVACGMPLLAIENVEAYISYESAKLRGNSQEYFFLRAVGDSMNDTNIDGKTIDSGDYVLIKKSNMPDFGNRVVALLGDEATIKKLRQGEDCIILQPESTNPANKPIYVFEDMLIQGVVVDVLKKGRDN